MLNATQPRAGRKSRAMVPRLRLREREEGGGWGEAGDDALLRIGVVCKDKGSLQ